MLQIHADYFDFAELYGKTKRSSRRNKGMSTSILDHFNHILSLDIIIIIVSYFVGSN